MKKALLILAVLAIFAIALVNAQHPVAAHFEPIEPRDTVLYTDSTHTDSLFVFTTPVVNAPVRDMWGM